MTPTPGRNPTLLPRTPRRNQQLLPKLSKRPPDHPQNIPIFWNKDSVNGPGQSRGNITPTSAPPTGFEPQLYIFYLNLFAPSAAPRGTISYSCITEIVPKLFRPIFKNLFLATRHQNNCVFAQDYFQLSVLTFMRAETDHLI